MNIKMLKRLKRIIKKRSNQFDMHQWFTKKSTASHCGTAACIAGWVLTLNDTTNKKLASPLKCANRIDNFFERSSSTFMGEFYNEPIQTEADNILDLTDGQSNRLFHLLMWPKNFKESYEKSNDPVEQAKIACERIDHFINTDGEE